jgi:hypothetical protein
VSWDLDVDEALALVSELLGERQPPIDDVWVTTDVEEHDWGWVIHWVNRRVAEGSTNLRDMYGGGGPFFVDKRTGKVAMAGSAHAANHYIALWRAGEWSDYVRPE